MSGLLTAFLRGLIMIYRYGLAPLIPGRCRYLPSCSHYGLEALQLHGPFHGTWLTLRRLLRCHPWGGHGYDPVPARRADAAASSAPSAFLKNR